MAGVGPARRAATPRARGASAFLQAPYLRDTMVAAGVLAETFETAITWDRFAGFVRSVREAAERRRWGAGRVTCRLTHVYPDGAAPYFTVLAPARRGAELDQWRAVKEAAAEAIVARGARSPTTTPSGRDHRPGLRPAAARALRRRAARRQAELDPAGILNPGVLIDP